MSSWGLLTDREQLESLFDELASELQRLGIAADIVMVGGSWMLWHSQRSATRDVDSARRFDTDLTEAIAVVGARHDMSKGWLNDAAAAYWPAGASFDECEIVHQRGTLVVRTPSSDVIFLMKLYRASPQDRDDMITIWPTCSFPTPDEAARAFRTSYPHAPEDEHLVDYIHDVAHDAGSR